MDAPLATRRALLGAALALPVAAGAAGSVTSTAGLAELRRKIEAHRQERDIWLAYRTETFDPMEVGSHEAREAVPHERTTLTYTNVNGEQASFSTERWRVELAQRTIASPPEWCAPDYFAAAQQAVQLAEAREAKLRAIDARFAVAAIEEREAELSDADTEAMHFVLAHRSTTVAEVLAKLRFIVAEDAWELTPAQVGIASDLERLGAGGQA